MSAPNDFSANASSSAGVLSRLTAIKLPLGTVFVTRRPADAFEGL